jgi:hypothetical protein
MQSNRMGEVYRFAWRKPKAFAGDLFGPVPNGQQGTFISLARG